MMCWIFGPDRSATAHCAGAFTKLLDDLSTPRINKQDNGPKASPNMFHISHLGYNQARRASRRVTFTPMNGSLSARLPRHRITRHGGTAQNDFARRPERAPHCLPSSFVSPAPVIHGTLGFGNPTIIRYFLWGKEAVRPNMLFELIEL